jgi:hypothetical protein
MKKVVLFAIVLGFIALKTTAINAQNIGLKWQNAGKKTDISPKLTKQTAGSPQLNLPKSDNALVRIQQNVFYTQSRYPQAYLNGNRGYSDYYAIQDRQLQLNSSQRELFVDRLIETAIVKLFKLD